jgi:hypothetical protein
MKMLHWFVPVLAFAVGCGGGYATSHLLSAAEVRNLQAKVNLQEMEGDCLKKQIVGLTGQVVRLSAEVKSLQEKRTSAADGSEQKD